jgi:hypothetical protein
LNDVHINRWGSACSIIAFAVSAASFLRSLLDPPGGSANILPLVGLQKVQTILFLGLAAAAAHGVLWAIAQQVFRWKFGAGGGTSLPEGRSAVVLSATMTIPLVLLPSLYTRLTHQSLLVADHKLAAWFVVFFAAIGHIFLYGAKALKFPGMRSLISPLHSRRPWKDAIFMEFVYAVTHFSSIVLVYRLIVRPQHGPLYAVYVALISAGVWFSCDCVSIFLNYPGSLREKRLIEVRGLINALMLTVTLEGGMLM